MTLSSSGNRWLIGPSSPKAAATAVAPRSTGTSAATSAPKASSSTSSVTGRESVSARFRSLPEPFWVGDGHGLDLRVCRVDGRGLRLQRPTVRSAVRSSRRRAPNADSAANCTRVATPRAVHARVDVADRRAEGGGSDRKRRRCADRRTRGVCGRSGAGRASRCRARTRRRRRSAAAWTRSARARRGRRRRRSSQSAMASHGCGGAPASDGAGERRSSWAEDCSRGQGARPAGRPESSRVGLAVPLLPVEVRRRRRVRAGGRRVTEAAAAFRRCS